MKNEAKRVKVNEKSKVIVVDWGIDLHGSNDDREIDFLPESVRITEADAKKSDKEIRALLKKYSGGYEPANYAICDANDDLVLTYNITITETRVITVKVDGTSEQDALARVMDAYDSGKISLDDRKYVKSDETSFRDVSEDWSYDSVND